MGNEDQREFLDARENIEQCEKLIKTLFQLVDKVTSDKELIQYALALINGIIEDNRQRIRFLSSIQKSRNAQKHEDCIRVLNSFLVKNNDFASRLSCDMAAHTLSQLIAFAGVDKHQEEAQNFLMYLIRLGDN